MSEASEKLKRYLALFPEVPDHISAMDRDAVTEDVTFGDLRALLAERMWRPISEAPRDGTPILGYFVRPPDCEWPGQSPFAIWTIAWGLLAEEWGNWQASGGDWELAEQPTHWMPLPPPPEAKPPQDPKPPRLPPREEP